MSKRFKQVYQFRVELKEVEPPIWRQIQVPETYSFWDLHVAIQDAMGWLDYHLHLFELTDPALGIKVSFGIPDDDLDELDMEILPGWEYPIAEYFFPDSPVASYTYDFGDDWKHTVTLEGMLSREKGVRYPRCLEGARACPREDCGGPRGYEELLRILRAPWHEDYEGMRIWAGEDFDPEVFSPAHVRFDDPHERWELAFIDA